MPVQAPQWTEFLLCPICTQTFEESHRKPISLGCGHTVCKMCLNKLHRKACPFDQTTISTDIEQLPVNTALLQLVSGQVLKPPPVTLLTAAEDVKHYEESRTCVEDLALYLKPLSNIRGAGLNGAAQSVLSRPMQRKLVTLVHCQLVEEEGRIRAMRAARSLGERTVTELILQHQNPQQLSSNLWAAVRARGCQFLGPAMQEEALKLVLLALEDGSALSRKVLVLFVVQRLEPRFPQASKTSIGHVVQLLYRASCFKVTKRDEDSSLMQLKEEFRTYEALRREHDSQIVQIAMEGGLRIAPDQWSSLLYGDQSHKSHMQSIIDKLQTPASFAQSVQELTIALQRTGDPANLNRLRPHLELLADIDPSPDAPAPTWEQLAKGLEAVRTVVHGLVDFIQNHSKKGGDQQQPPQHSKYKTYMCRDMKQKGGCPRGASCTFAHSQEELEKYRKMNKRLGMRRQLSQSLTQLNEMDFGTGLLPDEGLPMEGLPRKPSSITNVILATGPESTFAHLVSRGSDPSYDPTHRPEKMNSGSLSAPGSPPESLESIPKPGMFINSHSRVAGDGAVGQKHMPAVPRVPHMYSPHHSELYYSETRGPLPPSTQYESSQYPAGNPYPYHHVHPRYTRHPAQDPSMPPYPGSSSYTSERQCANQSSHYGYPSHHDGHRHSAYSHPQTFPPREELVRRSPDVPPLPPPQSASYLPEQDSYKHSNQIRNYPRNAYTRPQPSLDYLHRRRQEIMAQLEDRKDGSPSTFSSSHSHDPSYPQDMRGQSHYMEENSHGFGHLREPDYTSSYSPWSCDPFGSYIGGKDIKSKEGMDTQNLDKSKSLRAHGLELQRRAADVKDDDPIIPFGSLPTVSRFGAISRTSKSGYPPNSPMPPLPNSAKHTADYAYANHSGWSGDAYQPHQSQPQGHFRERSSLSPAVQGPPRREQLRMELQQVNLQISKQTQSRSQENPSSVMSQPSRVDWSSGNLSSEQLSLELHQVERDIIMRTHEMARESHDGKYKRVSVENGQDEHTLQRDEHPLTLSEGSNGSIGMSSLTSKTSSLSLSSEQVASSPDLPKNGVAHS
ncbi:LOW QUALITY PROTEIN: roquin-1-like [Cyprinus carpio]|uniref:RING-type E3 ubiquitin transferase n=1 Tax=Cyprinus carpio TaxID=7962 RepID=A0A9Q9VNP0_CYPCA|nr:LOW QUALITY PROTEIN: roquin-1-like [Cyprinus carpio]